jgi:2-polyprenyl-3-methyl-5-hydroxy-6-metoxy-1,4-benzoquinol methylase
MGSQTHWDNVYATKAAHEVSWFREHLETSLGLIERAAPHPEASIIDVGGGASTLADDLLALGYSHITVLDISSNAIAAAQARLGGNAERICWIAANINTVTFPQGAFDVWHDRAVFHFLTDAAEREAYVRQVARAVKPGGHVIVSTFGPEGPLKCSGLDVMRYDADSLHGEFGVHFRLIESNHEIHETPWGAKQQFLYCYCLLDTH